MDVLQTNILIGLSCHVNQRDQVGRARRAHTVTGHRGVHMQLSKEDAMASGWGNVLLMR